MIGVKYRAIWNFSEADDTTMIRTISPVDGKVVVERKSHSEQDVTEILKRATNAFKEHRQTPLSKRIEIANQFLSLLEENKDELVRRPMTRLT